MLRRGFLWGATIAALVLLTEPAQAQFPNLPSRPETPKSAPPSSKPAPPAKGSPGSPSRQPELWDEGDEVVPPTPLPGGRTVRGREERPADAAVAPRAGSADGPAWSVLLGSFTSDDHAQVAAAMRERLVSRYPEVRDAFVQRVAQGSVILVGRFSGPDDPAAQAKLKEVKSIVVDGSIRPFAGAMLTRTVASSGPPGPLDVRRLREHFPNVVPLYSLQVAAWSSFGEKGTKPSAIRSSADAYAKELRAKGFEAWVHHDDNTATSIVTVGHFDHSAYDPKSTLFAPEVEALLRKFPRHLVNGEEILVPVDPRKPEGAKRPQGCRLVEIPK